MPPKKIQDYKDILRLEEYPSIVEKKTQTLTISETLLVKPVLKKVKKKKIQHQ